MVNSVNLVNSVPGREKSKMGKCLMCLMQLRNVWNSSGCNLVKWQTNLFLLGIITIE